MIETIEQAAVRAMTDAGFASATATLETVGQHRHNLHRQLTVRALCPCGEPSGFGMGWGDGFDPPPDAIHGWLKTSALRHIEKDRAEGRWG